VVGSLFDGAVKEAEDGSDPDGVAAEEQVAGTGRHGEGELLELFWAPPGSFVFCCCWTFWSFVGLGSKREMTSCVLVWFSFQMLWK
jgi:hypothetical protein